MLSKILNAELTFDNIQNTGDLKKAVNLRQFKKPRARKIQSCNIQISQDSFCYKHGKGIDPDDRDDNKPGAGSDNNSDVTDPTPRIRTVSPTPTATPGPDINIGNADDT
ncbi:hypothetical protein N7481_010157 [Penicillium waksmanii]|uniref:uncharacterized protein n=1 Tax=Penicillium waksmanii TaxID=69791 RepID=UPI002546A4E7|nr:uncharacterized protein N7481_010157 [Penicillium waksmanii]KAJ5976450.1 hypothetical protein N7481_010157 [Penicillium waksmanii]